MASGFSVKNCKNLKLFFFIVFILSAVNSFSQGHIDRIKNMDYMKYKERVNCNEPHNEFEEKICANLAFQKSDSLLTLFYDSLLTKYNSPEDDSIKLNIIEIQTRWRDFRDLHCGIIFDIYKGGAGNFISIEYLKCMRELTEDRIRELKSIYYQSW